ncbi:hypothetical protein KUV85_04705 [Nocardioides panacisoli]|uniref:acVLRF1 family peptidyl-tRNA hydrolase n=1 Tax=Nocardioides panacisoli TaxID=627624 RepID=UPI001C62AB1E|nr:acVLRF1 family peptidyl-tRNA hydrolase [Nocardioides panacisoli]QYJ04991.1 hypothetical protein KUV85_04705 [Nocardioides panacisoli]
MPDVFVPPARWPRWVENFTTGHGGARLDVADGALRGEAEDGSWFVALLPFDATYVGPAVAEGFRDAAATPREWGLLLVRKGGFAVARMAGEEMVDSKVGRRHVQGRTKAGGQSQQRFARRREKQAREANEAAADHAARVLHGITTVVTGGDRAAVAEVLTDPRMGRVRPVERWLAVADPRRQVLERAATDARAVAVHVENAP